MPTKKGAKKGAEDRMLQMIRSQKGYKFSPRADPPTTVINPWCPVVLTFDMGFPITPPQQDVQAGTYRVHGSDIRAQLGSQLGIDLTKVNLLLRIRSISVWKLTVGPLGLTPTDPFDDTDSNALLQIEDSPGKATWARAGYHYPDFISERPWFVKPDTASHCATVIVASPTDKAEVLMHLQLLYKFDTATWPEFGSTRFPADVGYRRRRE